MKIMVCGIMRDLKQEKIDYDRKTKAICDAAKALKASRINSICWKYELESDEFFTKDQKAEDIYKTMKI